MKNKILKKLFSKSFYSGIIFFFCLSGCSYLTFSDSNEGAKITNSQIAAKYIESSVTLNQEWLTRYLFVSEYLKNQKISAQEYATKLANLKNRWDLNSHPLAKLKLENTSVNGNEAFVTFMRPSEDNKDFPLIKINLVWTGSSWAVSDDNILGKNELYDNLK
jgi:hypothetical protein